MTDRLLVVGWPYGDQGTWPMAVWSNGFVATEPDMRWQDRPAFLLDCRARQGQSGSPVLRHITPDIPVQLADGDTLHHGVTHTVLVGLYTGRIDERSDLGIVHTNQAIREVLQAMTAAP